MSDFKPFGAIVRKNLDNMLAGTEEIYRMDIDPNELWEKYPLVQLDTTARGINREIKAEGDESFIEETKTRSQASNELRLEIIKAIIAGKQANARAAETRAENATRLRRIDDALAKRAETAFEGMSEAELLAERAKLSA